MTGKEKNENYPPDKSRLTTDRRSFFYCHISSSEGFLPIKIYRRRPDHRASSFTCLLILALKWTITLKMADQGRPDFCVVLP